MANAENVKLISLDNLLNTYQAEMNRQGALEIIVNTVQTPPNIVDILEKDDQLDILTTVGYNHYAKKPS